jgi:PilZ domain
MEPRVDFREAVRVIWPGEVSGVVARAVNLSPTGILVDAPTPTPCAVGSDVLCDVALPRGPRLLRGRVAHRRVLPSAKVGMGIEFVDLSPREVAELRDVVDESEQLGQRAPQKVKVRFAGTTQVVRARAFPLPDGFRLSTSLPFLKRDTEVDIALAPDASVNARGWVSAVALEQDGADGTPKLIIDVRVDRSSELTPVVEPLAEALVQAVPEHVWEAEELDATTEPAFDAPVDVEKAVPTIVTAGPELPPIVEASGASPLVEGYDRTEIVSLERRPVRWRALGGGMIAGAIGLVAFVAAIVLMKTAAPDPSPPPSIAPPVIVTQPSVPVAPAAVAPSVVAPPVVAPPPAALEAAVAAPEPLAAEPVAAEPAVDFELRLAGSIAGARRYPLRDPDGVAFNLPRAHAAMKVGTYRPDVRGLKSMWIRALPGGGTHLRFFFASSQPAPRVELVGGAVRVTAR